MSIEAQFPNNKRCIERCGKVAICGKMIALGEADLQEAEDLRRGSDELSLDTSGAEFETDDGRLVGLEAFMESRGVQTPAMARRQALMEAGNALISSGTHMREMLIEVCPDGGPLVLTHRRPDPDEEGSFVWEEGAVICRSERSGSFIFTEADLPE